MSSQLNGDGFDHVGATRIDADGIRDIAERVAREVPVALVYNGISHAVMMASPLDLEDFALGFSLTEGILAHPEELLEVELRDNANGIEIEMRITERRMDALRSTRRNLTGRTGCGLCGADSLASAIRPLPQVTREIAVKPHQIEYGFAQMAAQQRLNQQTGAVHAAALVGTTGCLVREDIGRHNALDKLIGAMVRGKREDGFLLISSRASYEMVFKAAVANVPLLAAISAPSSLAVELAREAGITLIGFARREGMTRYTQGRGSLLAADLRG